jgi:hypothetical protein
MRVYDRTGRKHALGLWDGSTENAAGSQSLLAARAISKVVACAPIGSEPLGYSQWVETAFGREALRERTMIEHKLAHISQRQGNDARSLGVRKNTFDLRRASAVQNLETLHLADIQLQEAA